MFFINPLGVYLNKSLYFETIHFENHNIVQTEKNKQNIPIFKNDNLLNELNNCSSIKTIYAKGTLTQPQVPYCSF